MSKRAEQEIVRAVLRYLEAPREHHLNPPWRLAGLREVIWAAGRRLLAARKKARHRKRPA